jgi:FAD/FMN-containing dehydrogenase
MASGLESRITEVVGVDNVIPGAEVPPSPWDTRQPFNGRFVVTPRSVQQVSRVLALCNAEGQPVVPLGGVTGLVQGCATGAGDIGLSLGRMDAIEEVDPVAQTMTAQAGVTLRGAQEAAKTAGMLFPVDIGARDNCMLGGNVSTNAGGTRVIRYGMMRDSVLGLEAVLADGTVISSMNRYLKNNSGFDLKQLFIGTEGTLGIVTRLVIRLDVQPASHNVALLAVADYADVVAILGRARQSLGSALCGFEVMWRSFYAKATRPEGRQPSPIDGDHPFYVIIEAIGRDPDADAASFEAALFGIMEDGLAVDGVIAKSDRERESLWAVRHEVEWLVRSAFNFDVSLRVADAGQYVDELERRITGRFPDAYVAAFGHLGDNNVHISVLGGEETEVQEHVYAALRPYAGAISAEHGIGIEKRPYLPISRTPAEIALMASLKRMMDPRGILNPGKVVEI